MFFIFLAYISPFAENMDKQDIGARCGKTFPEICPIALNSKKHLAHKLLHVPGSSERSLLQKQTSREKCFIIPER